MLRRSFHSSSINRAIAAGSLSCLVVTAPEPVSAASIERTVEVKIDPRIGEIEITDEMELGNGKQHRFVLAPWLEIDSIQVDPAHTRVTREAGFISVATGTDHRHVMKMAYRGVIPPEYTAQDSAGISNAEDGTFLSAYDNWLAQDQRFDTSYRVSVTVPASQRAVVTGRLVDEQLDAGSYRATYHIAESAGEPPSLFTGPYVVDERRNENLPIRTYFHPELSDFSPVYLEAADTYLQRYQAQIGDYPWSSFNIISAPLPVGYGFPGIAYVSRRIVPLRFMQTRSLAHEVLHNWWGNGVQVDYSGGNWSEGLTTYMADYALERSKGDDEARTMRIRWLRDYAALPEERDRPVTEFRTKEHQAAQVIGYNKVAFIFHMLELEVGRETFNEAIRVFWEDYRHRQASWDDLRSAFESASGSDLGWFFEQWLDRAGAPNLTLGAHRVEALEQGYRTRIDIVQGSSDYRLRLPLLISTKEGPEIHTVEIDGPLTTLVLVTQAQPLSLQLDPDSDVFRRLAPNETPPILRDVTLSPNTLVLVDGEDPEFESVAKSIATRMLDTTPRFGHAPSGREPVGPMLVLTHMNKLPYYLETLSLEAPKVLDEVAHDAAAWAVRRTNGDSVLVVSAESVEAMERLTRPLPHYTGQSFILFQQGRAVRRGIFPIDKGALHRDLLD